MSTRGSVDMCQQRALLGWAIHDGRPANVRVYVNSEPVALIEPSVPRPDVADIYGVSSPVCGFAYNFSRGLFASDQLAVEVDTAGVYLDPRPHNHRVAALTYGIDATSPGLELGALDRPFFDRKHFNVKYVDHADTADLKIKYLRTGTPQTLDPSQIVDVDIAWTCDKTLSSCCGESEKFHYAIALQVMEHVGDPIGWLNEISACLVPGGRINLTIPEMTRTFDYRRRLTTAAELVEAFEGRWRWPRLRQVFDHISNAAQPPATADQSAAGLQQALRVARVAEAGEYVDVHCHVWTHDSFLETWQIIERLELCRAKLDRSWPAVAGANEFTLSFVV
jgi:Methyltransferase domain